MMRFTFVPALELVAIVFSTTKLMSASIQFQSAPTQTQLLELYTSEGCSSCPPAEEWLSRLKKNSKLWKDFVPVAFHVDYWDYLGWKDRFASEAYTQRQHAYANEWRNRSVYTPGFVLAGKERRNGFNRDELPAPSHLAVGTLTAKSENGDDWKIRFQPVAEKEASSYLIHAALLGFDRSSDVKAGENSGRKLQHDFVVLALVETSATRDGTAFEGTLSLSPKSLSPRKTAFAAWVTPAKTLEPVQALGGWLPSAKLEQ